jgi:hypothetical protein
MHDIRTVKIRIHRRNIKRYSRLLATELTELERSYLHKRIAEEQAELERWTAQRQSEDAASNLIAKQAVEPSASPSTTDP